MKAKTYEIDMCNGPLFSKILLFSVPLMFSGILQLLFNTVDMIVAGRYVGSSALAAVGATSSLINLLISVFMGLSVGTNVLVAHYFGAGQAKDIHETIHTSILLSIISGFILTLIGILLAKPLLALMGTPVDVLVQSSLYMRFYFLGMPAMLLYNFGSAILRATGDTKRPLYFLIIAGVVNVILNLFFVIVLHLGVVGVALATITAQYISAALITLCLARTSGICHLDLKKLHIYPDKLVRILKIGLPAGLQGAVFSISNVLIQSSINSFGSIAMAGNTATSNIEGFIYISMNAFYQTSLSFTSQNLGGRQYKRIQKVLLICLACVTTVGCVMGFLALYFGTSILSLYSSNPEVIAVGLGRMQIIFITYFTCGIMDTFVGCIRGLGYSILPMIVSLLGACGLRILWIFTIFTFQHTLPTLYLSYPVSWTLTASAHLICFLVIYKHIKRAEPPMSPSKEQQR